MLASLTDIQLAVLVFCLTVLTHISSAWLVRRLLDGKSRAGRLLASRFKLAPGQTLRELRWLHWSLMCTVWFASVLLVLRVMGEEQRASELFRTLAGAGFSVAGMHVVPARIVMGVMLVVLLVSLARLLRAVLEARLQRQSGVDASVGESLATLAGYAGFVLAFLVGLNTAGFNLTNLAIVAGALSVGIGFGLQNIVNNFISGLILLSERPVRRGDYVRVGDVEGVVRKVHIRSTEIETLDRVSVVVPNSDLIASPVYNWRLRDPYTRVVIPVGVAYGSDVDKVRALLVEVGLAHEHTLPINTPGVPDTHAYFMAFGASSLDFELRTFIRDVDRRGQVASDLRFAIDKAFRQHGVEIPFPQRVIWMKQNAEQ